MDAKTIVNKLGGGNVYDATEDIILSRKIAEKRGNNIRLNVKANLLTAEEIEFVKSHKAEIASAIFDYSEERVGDFWKDQWKNMLVWDDELGTYRAPRSRDELPTYGECPAKSDEEAEIHDDDAEEIMRRKQR